MKLDRNLNENKVCKYRLLNMQTGELEFNNTPNDECFVIKLKDAGAKAALKAYAEYYKNIDPEYAQDIFCLSERSGIDHPLCKTADSRDFKDYAIKQ